MASLSAVYNNLRDVYAVSKLVKDKPEAIHALAQLLVTHGLNGVYDIRLNHKHFDIAEDKQVVGFSSQAIQVSAVCKNGELPLGALQEANIQPLPTAGGAITPSDYLISDGEATPYEFGYTTGSTSTSTRALGPLDKGFLAEWSSILGGHDLAGLLSLSVQEEGVPVDAYKVSDPVARINKLYYGEAPIDGISVVTTT